MNDLLSPCETSISTESGQDGKKTMSTFTARAQTSTETMQIVEDVDGIYVVRQIHILGATHVKGLSCLIANSEEEALNYLFEGETNRSIAQHVLNKQSSRSHCIFTVHLEIRSRVESEEKIIKTKIHLCDLAVR